MLRDCWDYMVYKAEDIVQNKKKSSDRINSRKKFIFQKTAVCIAGILWLITAARVFWNTENITGNQKVISAFGSNSYREMSADITTYGKYGNMELTDTAKGNYIGESGGKKFGIHGYSITNTAQENGVVKTLSKSSDNGDVVCKFINI